MANLVRTGATVQYYPLTFTTFWSEYHLWGLQPLGYHLINVFLHSVNAMLFWLVLRRLGVPGAWLAAGLFALHPVCVESVAWVTERKNTLSGLFYLSSLSAALRFWLPGETAGKSDSSNRFGDGKCYGLALGLYLCALWSKTAAAPLPVVILLLVWWKGGRIVGRDIYYSLPFFLVGAVMGFITVHIENHLGAGGRGWDLPWLERGLIAGWDFWFYLGKLFWPHPLIFVYPRWEIQLSRVSDYLPSLGVVLALAVVWWKRRIWGRTLPLTVMYYLALLSLVLGFFDVFYFRYSFVSDHFQYLAMLGPLALVAAGITVAFNSLGKQGRWAERSFGIVLFSILGLLTWNQCRLYANSETLWRGTIAANPNCWMAHNNLGKLLLDERQTDEALVHLQKAAEIQTNDAATMNNLGSAWLQKGDRPTALVCFQMALKIQPDYSIAYNNLGDFYLKGGQSETAIPYLQKALALDPDLIEASYNLGNAWLQSGKTDAAVQQWQKVLARQPDYVPALNNLGNYFLQHGETQTAIGYLQKAIAIQPDFADANNNLGNALIESGRVNEAIPFFKRALKARPDYVGALNNLGWVLATCPLDTLRNGGEALGLARRANRLSGGNNPLILRTLAAAYAENGQFADAMSAGRQAIRLLQPDSALAANIQAQIQLYETGQRFRDATLIDTSGR